MISPSSQQYDEDGDKLVDIHLSWRDSLGAVDRSSFRLRSLDGDTTNLLSTWDVRRVDDTSAVISEKLSTPLHSGPHNLEFSIADTAGNTTIDTISFTLPHATFLKTLTTGLPGYAHIIGATTCPDDHRAYFTAGRRLVVLDVDSLRILGAFFSSEAADNMSLPLCIAADSLLYVTERVLRFDRKALAWTVRANPSFVSVGITQSRSDSDIIYVGETTPGTIGLISRASAARIGQLLEFSPTKEYVFDLAVLAGDTKLYATRLVDGGIFVIDPKRDTILKHISVGGPTWPDAGRTDAIVLSADDRTLYVAVLDGAPRGLLAIDTQTDSIVRTLPLAYSVPQELALSPDQRRIFVTTQDQYAGIPSANYLIDVQEWRVLESFARPRPAGQIRFDGGVTCSLDGKFIFVGHNLDIDVYLNRE